MTAPTILGPLSGLHGLMQGLIEDCEERTLTATLHPDLAPLAWYYVHAVYTEAYWLREVIQGDDTYTAPLRELMRPDQLSAETLAERIPPRDHLLRWGRQLQDDNLMLLANPALQPDHPLLKDGYLANWLLQQNARRYEEMLQALTQQAILSRPLNYKVASVLVSSGPEMAAREMGKGYFRVGGDPAKGAIDNELPPQMVELSAFRITTLPVNNAQFLGFIEADGYSDTSWWDESGQLWLKQSKAKSPHHWRRDLAGHWFGLGLNGPYDLTPDEPVLGISQHEARAYARWAGSNPEMEGAVLPHEYQWEFAGRMGLLEQTGRVWEWCANPFHAYTGYQPQPEIKPGDIDANPFDLAHFTLRGGSLHTQPVLRRASVRNWALPGQRTLFSGLRLVLPPLPGCGILDVPIAPPTSTGQADTP